MNALASSMVGKMKIRFTLPAHCGFEFLDRDRNFPVTQHAAALFGDQNVVLDADAAEVAVGLQRVVVHDALVFPFGAALVDQRRMK